LAKAGATIIYGIDINKMVELEELESNRRKVELIADADVVMVPLEDGDRTKALKKLKKTVIAIDLNPLSRTALWADITIVDNIVRTAPEMIKIAQKLKKLNTLQLKEILDNFDNKLNIQNTLNLIVEYIDDQKEKAFEIVKF
jgi:4-phosphopantoate--beta-alanine ligase